MKFGARIIGIDMHHMKLQIWNISEQESFRNIIRPIMECCRCTGLSAKTAQNVEEALGSARDILEGQQRGSGGSEKDGSGQAAGVETGRRQEEVLLQVCKFSLWTFFNLKFFGIL